MPVGVYPRTEKQRESARKLARTLVRHRKSWIAPNKGQRSPAIEEKLHAFRAGEPVSCTRHGSHREWRVERNAYLKCLPCGRERANGYRKTLDPIMRLLYDARGRRWELEIDYAFMESMRSKQGNRCALSGVEFNERNVMSLDRIDSARGYTKDNVQLVLWEINRMKTDLPQELFLELCGKVARNRRLM